MSAVIAIVAPCAFGLKIFDAVRTAENSRATWLQWDNVPFREWELLAVWFLNLIPRTVAFGTGVIGSCLGEPLGVSMRAWGCILPCLVARSRLSVTLSTVAPWSAFKRAAFLTG